MCQSDEGWHLDLNNGRSGFAAAHHPENTGARDDSGAGPLHRDGTGCGCHAERFFGWMSRASRAPARKRTPTPV